MNDFSQKPEAVCRAEKAEAACAEWEKYRGFMLSHGFTLPPYPGQAILDELAKLRKDVQERDDRLAAADELIAKLFTGRYYSSLAEIRQDCNVQGHGNLWCLQVPVIQWFHYAGPYSTREAALAAYDAAKESK